MYQCPHCGADLTVPKSIYRHEIVKVLSNYGDGNAPDIHEDGRELKNVTETRCSNCAGIVKEPVY